MNPSTKTKVEIKQNNILTVISLIKILVYQWDPRQLQGSHVVYITKSVFYPIFNNIFVYINH